MSTTSSLLSALNGTSGDSSSTSSGSNSVLGKDDFMQLLVMQLRNQDPLNPLDDREFISQMAQLSSLESTNSLQGYVEQVVVAEHQSQALQMAGRDVVYTDETGAQVQGKVTAVRLDTIPPRVVVGNQEISFLQVQKVL